MPPFVLTVLKVSLLLLLYFFVYRAVRAIVADLYGRPRAARTEPAAKPQRRGRGVPARVLVMDQGRGKGTTHRLQGTTRIGRDASCEITLSDTYVSQQHARIADRNGAWVVEDLGSTNGTYLNRRKVTVPTVLSPGDRIRVGNTLIEVRR